MEEYQDYSTHIKHKTIQGCDSNFDVNIFQIFKVATNEISTLHYPICTLIALEIYNKLTITNRNHIKLSVSMIHSPCKMVECT